MATKQCFYIIKPKLLPINLDVLWESRQQGDKPIHKRALRILFKDYEDSFEELLQRNIEQTTDVKNLHKLMTEVYKALNCQNPAFVWDLFIRYEVTYDLREEYLLQLLKTRTVLNGLNSIVFRGSILWNTISCAAIV